MSSIQMVRKVMWLYHLNPGHPYCLVFRCSVFRWLLYSQNMPNICSYYFLHWQFLKFNLCFQCRQCKEEFDDKTGLDDHINGPHRCKVSWSFECLMGLVSYLSIWIALGLTSVTRPLCLVESHTLDAAARQERYLFTSQLMLNILD